MERPIKYKTEEECRQGKLENNKRWRDTHKEQIAIYRKKYYQKT